ncbi:hypothetical protein [Agaribacterium haliotis]|uniref:hypothetical protein n=1 Tax=Agaribacterium haliotis TaxID=2013869 RepID=UPI000BB569BF|nr:hypothetical protein [Agaribacterium haliotis]
MSTNNKASIALAGSLCLGLAAAQASAELQWNGFITAGGGMASEDGLFGYEEDLTFNNESILGLQLTGDISDKLSATGQIVARGDEDMEVDVSWAYLSYKATDKTTLRLGRFRTPFYLYSDFLEVGYAYHWISPPNDVYSLPADSIDGFDVVYNTPLGATDFTAQFYGGSVDSEFTVSGEPVETDIRNQAGLALTLNWEWLTLRASHHYAAKVNFVGLEDAPIPVVGSIGALQDGLETLTAVTGDQGYAQAASNLSVEDVEYTFDEIAIKIEWNNILFVAEATELKAESGLTDQQNRNYVSLGYNIGPVLLHVTQSRADDDVAAIADTITVLDPGVWGAELSAQSAGAKLAVNGLAERFAVVDRTTNTLGVRWDFTPGAAFKIEGSDVDYDDGTSGQIYRFVIDAVY